MQLVAADTANAPSRLLLCLSHLRWDLVFQRPQHLMSRAAEEYAVIYLEEPVYDGGEPPRLASRAGPSGVEIATPRLPQRLRGADVAPVIRALVDARLEKARPTELVAWYYTPMALEFSDHLRPDVVVYDCMDELSAFKDAPANLLRLEEALFARADVVFTGGRSLYEAKHSRHPRVFAYSSSVDVKHFAGARRGPPDPADQMTAARPRIGFFGVIDERMDLPLVAQAARELPDVSFVMLGPVVKIDPATLPRAANLHWLGPKRYEELPAYLGNWNAGWMPFALNEATRFISPTKTPEFLAAGLPLTSTAVTDVARDYGRSGLVRITDASRLTSDLRASLAPAHPSWRRRVDRRLAQLSWDRTWSGMRGHLQRSGQRRIV